MIRKMKLSTALHKPRTSGVDPVVELGSAPHANIPQAKARSKSRVAKPQGIAMDQFLYFFLRLRKGEVRRVVQRAQSLYPGESPEKLARRLINTQSTLTFLGGALLHLPGLLPGAGSVLKFAGFAGGASIITRMHLYMILEIAHLFGHDIDDQARVPEMMAIVAASGAVSASPYLVQALNWHRLAAIPASAVAVVATTQLIGASAIIHYSRKQSVKDLARSSALPQPALA